MLVLLNLVIEKYILFQDKSKDKVSKFDTLRHSIAGIIRSPKSVLGSSSVSFITESPSSPHFSVCPVMFSALTSLCLLSFSFLMWYPPVRNRWASKSGIMVPFPGQRLRSCWSSRETSWCARATANQENMCCLCSRMDSADISSFSLLKWVYDQKAVHHTNSKQCQTSNLSLEVQSAAEFSSTPDQTHLPVIF